MSRQKETMKRALNPLGAAKSRDRRSSPAAPAQSTQNIQRVTSAARKTASPKSKEIGVPAAVTVTSPVPQRNINDESYARRSAPATQPGTSRIGEQMQNARSQPDYPQKSQRNIEQKKAAREKLATRGPKYGLGPLNTRRESGMAASFAAGHTLSHKRGPQGQQNQEPNRMTKLSPNLRPSQRTHQK